MILRDIQRQPHMRVEIAYGLELKTGKLQHVPAVLARARDHRRHRRSDIAAHLRLQAGHAQDVADQAGGGGFSVGACDADGAPLQKRRCQFDFADHLHAAPASGFQRSQVRRNVRRNHHRVALRKHRRRLQFEWDIEARQHLGGLAQFGQRLQVGRAHARAQACQKLRRRQPRFFHADHQHSGAGPVRCHLSFRVVSANSASTRPAIQKRAMIFDSVHPSCSK